MLLRGKNPNPNTILGLGFAFLIVASLGRYFVRPAAGFSEGIVDGLHGFLYGITIGTFLVGLWLARRRRLSGRD